MIRGGGLVAGVRNSGYVTMGGMSRTGGFGGGIEVVCVGGACDA